MSGHQPTPPTIGVRVAAFSVHVLTASGVGLGLLALLAAHERRWTAMFLWLGVALLVDAIDGPLARWLKVAEILPRWSGDVLDLVVDYLNYVLVPAYALVVSGLLPAPLDLVAGFAIAITAALYFADLRMKTEQSYFRGFPAVWNVVVFYLFLFKPGAEIVLAVVLVFCAMTFVPILFLHPIRVRRHRIPNLVVLAFWIILAVVALVHDLSPPPLVAYAFLAIGIYFLLAGTIRTRT